MFVERKIPLYKLNNLLARVNKLNNRAKKRGALPFEVEFGESYVDSVKDKNGLNMAIDFIDVKVKGELPKVPGYTFLGMRVEKDGLPFLIGNVPDQFQDINDPECFHCQTKRNRHDYAIVEKAGEVVTLGKSCFKACFDDEDAEGVLSSFAGFHIVCDELGSDLDDDYGGSKGNGVFSPKRFLINVAMVVASDRFVSSSEAQEGQLTPTWSIAKACYSTSGSGIPSESDLKKAEEIIEYFKDLPKDSSSFLLNVRTRLLAGAVSSDSLPLIACAISVFDRWVSDKLNALQPPASESEYIGQIKSRQDFELIILFVFHGENRFGSNSTFIFSDEKGNRLLWKTSKCLSGDFEKTEVCPEDGPFTYKDTFFAKVGDKVKVKGSIVRHEPYIRKGESIKTTHINRLKLLSFMSDGIEVII